MAALQIIEGARDTFTLVSLTATEVMHTIRDVAQRNLPGPFIYDALILACARKMKARTIYTNDVHDFRLIAPDLASRIVEP